jgi:hypothetical protein
VGSQIAAVDWLARAVVIVVDPLGGEWGRVEALKRRRRQGHPPAGSAAGEESSMGFEGC